MMSIIFLLPIVLLIGYVYIGGAFKTGGRVTLSSLNYNSKVRNYATKKYLIHATTSATSAADTKEYGNQNLNNILSERISSLQSNLVTEKVNLDLPSLSSSEEQQLLNGERIQKQARNGNSGYGVVVVDVKASLTDVFTALAAYNQYDGMIPTVRRVHIYSNDGTKSAAEFTLSKFRLKINVVNTILPDRQTIRFSLDPYRPNLVLRKADGFWHVEEVAHRPGYSRVYLSANVVASRFVPTIIVDYAAARALPRATSWLQSYFSR